MNEGIFGDAFSQPDMGMGGYINPIAQTDLQKIGRLPMRPPQQQGQQDNTAALLGLLSMGRGALSGGSGTGAPAAPGDPTTNALPGLIGMTSVPAAFMSYLYRSGLFERGAANLGDRVITPLANFGGRASPANQLNQVTNTLLGGNSGNAQGNYNNLLQVSLNNMRRLSTPGNLSDPHAYPITQFSRQDLLNAGATPAELAQWGVT